MQFSAFIVHENDLRGNLQKFAGFTTIMQALNILAKTKHIKQMQSDQMMTQTLASYPSEPLALIGIGYRLPGGVSNPEDFWQLLVEGHTTS